MEIHWNTVITIDVFLLLGSEIYLFWLIDWYSQYSGSTYMSLKNPKISWVIKTWKYKDQGIWRKIISWPNSKALVKWVAKCLKFKHPAGCFKTLGQEILIENTRPDIFRSNTRLVKKTSGQMIKANTRPSVLGKSTLQNALFSHGNAFFPNSQCKVFWCFQGVEKGCIGSEWIKNVFVCLYESIM